MKITEVTTRWEHTACEHEHVDWSDIKDVIETYQPVVVGRVADLMGGMISEATVKEIKSLFDDDFLRQKERSRELEGFRKFGHKGDTITYYVPSAKTRIPGHMMQGKGYHVKIAFNQWNQLVEDRDLNVNEAARMAFWVSDVRLSCTCPSFIYFGFQHLLDVLGASIYPEVRKPVKMNPMETGICCKHLRRVLDYLGGNITDLATEIKNQRNMTPDHRKQEIEKQKRDQALASQAAKKQSQVDI